MKIKSLLLVLGVLIVILSVLIYVNLYLQRSKASEITSATPSLITNFPVQADNIETINGQLAKIAQEIAALPSKPQNMDTIRTLAKERKNIMLSYLPENPDKFLENTLPDEVLNKWPDEFKNSGLFELKKEIKGKLEIVVEEDFDNQKTNYKYKLDDKDLYISTKSEPLGSSGEVAVLAYSLDSNLIVYNSGSIEYLSPALQTVTGNLNILVVRAQSDSEPSLIDEHTLNNIVFGTLASVAAYYNEVSKSLVNITGQITPIINLTSPLGSCDKTSMTAEVDEILQQQGYNLSAYRSITYLLPGEGCSPSGSAVLGGQKVWLVGFNDSFDQHTLLFSLIHEFGHNLGLMHANSYECGLESFGSNRDNCIEYEYSDRFDPMGSSLNDNISHFNGTHKLALGWISDSEYLKITNDKQVDIYAHESNETGIKLVRIWRNVDNDFIYLSFRQALGLDSTLPQGIVNGVNVHMTKASLEPADFIQTRFIDAHPSTVNNIEDWLDAAMADGETLTDTYININQISHTASHATVSVDIPDNYPPVITYTQIDGLYASPPGSSTPYIAYLNNNLRPYLNFYDYSDDATAMMKLLNPDGSEINLSLNSELVFGTKLCQELKCYATTNTTFAPDQLGQYKMTFTITDARGGISNQIVYDFMVVSELPTSPTPTPICLTCPRITPTPSSTPTPTPTTKPTPYLTLTPTLTPVASQNLLINPGFELDANQNQRPDYWTSNSNFTRRSGWVHSGSYSGRHYSSANVSYNINQTIKNITGNTSYAFSGWTSIPELETPDSFTYKIQLIWKNASGNNLRTDTLATFTAKTGGWKQTLVSKVSPTGAASVLVRMNVSSLNATIFTDDFSLRRE